MFRSINKNRSFVARNITHKCLCIICTLLVVFSNAVPSHAVVATLGAITTAAEAGNTVGELFGRVLEDFFGLQHQCTLTEATLITINRSLDALFTNTYGYDIVNPYTGNNDTINVSARNFGQMMADINNSIATLGLRFLRPINSNILGVANSISSLETSLNNSLYDYQHIGQSSWSIGSTSRNTAVNTYNLNHVDWTVANSLVSITDPDGNTISQGSSIAPPYCDFHFGQFNSSNDAIYKFSLAISAYSYRTINSFINHVEVINGTSDFEPIIVNHYYTGQNTVVNVVFSNLNTNTRDLILRVYLDDYGYASRTDSTMYYINSDNVDYYTVSDNSLLRALLEKDNDVNVNFNDANIINAIDDLSLVDNDVKLTPVIDIDLPTNGTNIVDRLRLYFSTGVTVNQFFNAVDNAELGWYDQENSDVINTLSGGYVNLYE